MNEGTKTGLFWGVAVVMLAIAMFVAWPTTTDTEGTFINELLFEQFTDPLAAASMKIVTFDEERGQLATFDVRKNPETGLWTIPSRDGYPADALAQMREAANALVGLKILDTQTSNAEDHDDLGVTEPKLEDLEVGDEGVGRLITFKDEAQETLASLVIGDPLDDDPQKRYVRVPGQDPVYVVKLDVTPMTTKFQDWIESDLLQLSSIDISDMEIKDYSASLGAQGQIALTRSYTATVKMEGSQWALESLLEYDPKNAMADPTPVQPSEDQKLNKARLDAIKNALDDLKIVDVLRKPDGMSANLRANQDLLSDKDAVGSLAQRGFYPVPSGPNGEMELLSANGELNVALQDGVKYVMRFGNISGVSESGDAGGNASDEGGVNRYLLVTTMVDQSKFPVPELKAVPQTLEDLEAILNPKPAVEPAVSESEGAAKPEGEEGEKGDSEPEADGEKSADENAEPVKEDAEPANEDADADESAADSETPAESDSAQEAESEGETETSGEGEATGKGQAQQAADQDTPDDEQLTEEELLERLEAEQEKITKENQRKLDARKDLLEAAERRVRALNARFADWYYVIPESTYSQLRIKRDQLFEQPGSADRSVNIPLNATPQFQFPTAPTTPPQ